MQTEKGEITMPWIGIVILAVMIIFVVVAVFFQDKVNTDKIRKVLEYIFAERIEVDITLGGFVILGSILGFFNTGETYFLLTALMCTLIGLARYFIFYRKTKK